MRQAIRKTLAVGFVAAFCATSIEIAEFTGLVHVGNPFIGEAEARPGRPLSPTSFAGVARRTSRRVARRTTIRLNSLPRGCVYGPYYGDNYWNCGGSYYIQENNYYIQVTF